MAEEVVATPVEPTPAAPEPAAPTPAATTPDPAPTPAPAEPTPAAAASAAAATPGSADWRDDRIRVLTARLRETQSDLARAKGDPVAAAAASGKSEAQIRQEIEAELQQKNARIEFDNRCNEVAKNGRASFNDFDARVGQLRQIIDPSDPVQARAYHMLLEASIESGKAPEVLHALGGDLNEASRILALSPTKMAIEIAKLAVGNGKELSSAPRPIPAIGGRATQHEAIDPTDAERSDKLSTAEWMRRRNEQLAKRSDQRGRA